MSWKCTWLKKIKFLHSIIFSWNEKSFFWIKTIVYLYPYFLDSIIISFPCSNILIICFSKNLVYRFFYWNELINGPYFNSNLLPRRVKYITSLAFQKTEKLIRKEVKMFVHFSLKVYLAGRRSSNSNFIIKVCNKSVFKLQTGLLLVICYRAGQARKSVQPFFSFPSQIIC